LGVVQGGARDQVRYAIEVDVSETPCDREAQIIARGSFRIRASAEERAVRTGEDDHTTGIRPLGGVIQGSARGDVRDAIARHVGDRGDRATEAIPGHTTRVECLPPDLLLQGRPVDLTVAVVVRVIAYLDGTRVDLRVAVIAIAWRAPAVAVTVGPVVDEAIAVVVFSVTDLWCPGINPRIFVGLIGRVALRLLVTHGEAVAVAVLVRRTVAVVVLGVADLRVAGESLGVLVVAVSAERVHAVVVAVALASEDHHAAQIGLHLRGLVVQIGSGQHLRHPVAADVPQRGHRDA